jgi:glucokinase
MVQRGILRPRAHQASIGAGTGLGKVALLWNSYFKRYLPFASEGGHADCAAQSPFEMELFEFIKQEKNHNCPVSWEDVLSGVGIQRIYRFLGLQKKYPLTSVSQEIAEQDFHPDKISRYNKQNDPHCQDTFKLYTQLYARCAKNFVLDTLALNGMYIAGGIAAKNVSIFFDPLFIQEFQKCGKYSELLKNVPLHIIADYNVSLYGAWGFMQLHNAGIL